MTHSWKTKTVSFLISQGVSLFGSSLVSFAIVWYVTLITSSGVWVSALTICSFVPQFIISFFSGVWADKFSRKRLIILADSVIAAVTVILALLMPHIGEGRPLMAALLIVSVIRSLGAGIQTPAVNAVIPQLVPEEHLMRFNGVNATLQSVVQFAAPAAAGAILTISTLRATLFIDILTAVIGVSLLSCIAIPSPRRSKNGEVVSVIADMKLGMKYALSHRFIGKLLLSYGLFIFLAVPAGFLATLFVRRTYGDSYVIMSLVEIVGFIGMAAGGVLIGVWGGFADRVKNLLAGMAAFGALAVGMGVTRSFLVYLILMAVYGIALTTVQTAVTTLIQERAEEEMQGRVFGFLGAMYSGFLPFGMAVFGPLADAVPIRMLMIFSGAVLLVMALVLRSDKNIWLGETGLRST
jgi:DHA3 family macrolide efflux protein-like MFS transporter